MLSYSRWTYVELALSETFEALVSGLQGALWTLGAAPAVLRHDNLSAATHELKRSGGRQLTVRFRQDRRRYGRTPFHTQSAAGLPGTPPDDLCCRSPDGLRSRSGHRRFGDWRDRNSCEPFLRPGPRRTIGTNGEFTHGRLHTTCRSTSLRLDFVFSAIEGVCAALPPGGLVVPELVIDHSL